jgi:hypothetical protein
MSTSPNKYSSERVNQAARRIDLRFQPYVLDSNPFPDEVALGIPGFPKGRVFPGSPTEDIVFSEDLRKNETDALNKKIEDFTYSREPNILWVCGKRGVGKTTLLQYFFKKPLLTSELESKVAYWYITYDHRDDVKFLINCNKYLLEQLNENLKKENVDNSIYLDAIVGAVFTFLTHEKFEAFKSYLTGSFSDEELLSLRTGIKENGIEYFKNLIETVDDDGLNNIVKLVQITQELGVLNVDKTFLDKFIVPFIKAKLQNSFLNEDKTRSFIYPKSKAEQEAVLVNTIKFLTSGAFSHFILVLDQIDLAWIKSRTAYKRKENFFNDLSALIRQLNDSGFILILAVMDETEKELKQYISKNPEARRIASNEKNYLQVPEISTRGEVEALLKEYLNKNPFRRKHLADLEFAADKAGTLDELFPFDQTACDELIKRSDRTTNDILSLAYSCLEICAEKLDQEANPDSSTYKTITASIVKEILS